MMPTYTVPGVYTITIPTPFDVGPVNLYLLVDTHSLTLVDTGPQTQEAEAAFMQRLQELGYAVEDLTQIVLTHFHVDHTGLLEKLVKRSGATVYAHPLTERAIRNDGVYAQEQFHFFRDLYLAMGVSPELAEQGLSQLNGYQAFSGRGHVDCVLSEGASVPGHEQWQVLYTPGHAQDHISLYREADRTMLLGDHLIAGISSNALIEPPTAPGQPRPKTLLMYREALRKIQAIPWHIGFSGHGDPITAGQELIEKRLKDGERRAQKIVDLVAAGKRTALEVALALFPRHLDQVPLILSETLGHLDWMVEAGALVVKSDARGVWHYRVTGTSPFSEK